VQPASSVTSSSWSIRDFVLVVLAGFAGGVLGALAGLVTGDVGTALVAGLAFQYGGNLVGLRLLMRRKGSTWHSLGLDLRPADGWYLFAGVGLQVGLALAFAPLAALLGLEGSAQAVAELLPESDGVAVRVLLVLGIALLAPLTEELMFRGVLLQALERRLSMRSALVWSSAVFAVFHLLGLSAENPVAAAALALPQLFLVGLVLGRSVRRHLRLGPAVFVHAGYNLIAVLVLIFAVDLPV
jgi:membrane protease YdiL (CAAX protease family)